MNYIELKKDKKFDYEYKGISGQFKKMQLNYKHEHSRQSFAVYIEEAHMINLNNDVFMVEIVMNYIQFKTITDSLNKIKDELELVRRMRPEVDVDSGSWIYTIGENGKSAFMFNSKSTPVAFNNVRIYKDPRTGSDLIEDNKSVMVKSLFVVDGSDLKVTKLVGKAKVDDAIVRSNVRTIENPIFTSFNPITEIDGRIISQEHIRLNNSQIVVNDKYTFLFFRFDPFVNEAINQLNYWMRMSASISSEKPRWQIESFLDRETIFAMNNISHEDDTINYTFTGFNLEAGFVMVFETLDTYWIEKVIAPEPQQSSDYDDYDEFDDVFDTQDEWKSPYDEEEDDDGLDDLRDFFGDDAF